jgi:hypothetical protein
MKSERRNVDFRLIHDAANNTTERTTSPVPISLASGIVTVL